MTLTKSEIDKIIKMDLNDWEFINSKIVRFIPRCDEVSLGKIVKAIWDYAEKVDHHPDVLLTYSGVKIILFTHFFDMDSRVVVGPGNGRKKIYIQWLS